MELELEAECPAPEQCSSSPEKEKTRAKTVFKHNVESGVTPPGASANQQAMIRLCREHGTHAGVPGWREQSPISLPRPLTACPDAGW